MNEEKDALWKDQFKDAKIGDIVYSVTKGKGIIVEIFNSSEFPIVVEFRTPKNDKPNTADYNVDGFYSILEKFPELFWDEIPLPKELPKGPKKMIKKELKGFISIYRNQTDPNYVWSSRIKFIENVVPEFEGRIGNRSWPVTIEYEEEE